MTVLANRIRFEAILISALSALWLMAAPAGAQVTAFTQALAEAASKDKAIAEFYKARNYEPIWTGRGGKDSARRKAFLSAVSKTDVHGLPENRYDPNALKAEIKAAKSQRERGLLEVRMSQVFLQYARDIQTGVLRPASVDSGIVRAVPLRNRTQLLGAFAKSSPQRFLKSLPPNTAEYNRLMKEKLTYERLVGGGGWGQKVPAKSLKPGDSGNAVVILRNRLTAKKYMKRSAAKTYDATLQKAVQQFQLANGLAPNGIANPGTMLEINRSAQERLQSIIVAMERERWMNQPRGKRHVLVNITDFSAAIIDNDRVTFKTRSVVGKNQYDRRTPEFSDVMEHMVINPTWNVPRSIATKEYLPLFKKNPNAAGHMVLYDGRGRRVSRANIDFSTYNERNFPYDIKQPPSRRNALGLVKFMFPNKYNIYLHDTPAKNLFSREARDFSHGCVRLNDPFDFAYELLSKQEKNPEAVFQAKLKGGRETVVPLENPVPIHLIYRTAYTQAKGRIQFRRDVYGRDGKIWAALAKAGVVLRAVQS